MKKRYLLLFGLLSCLAIVFSGYKLVFNIPEHPQLITVGENSVGQPLVCFQDDKALPLDQQGQLGLLVWNIYKQNREGWSEELSRLSSDAQLLLLQEASLNSGLKQWLSDQGWEGNQVNAFKVMGESAGVINLARTTPNLACGYTEMEPWLRLPKSGIYARYPLSNGQVLAVVNLHSVNFTYGTDEYQLQLEALANELSQHTGPIIVAGDFNSWSEERMSVMKQVLTSLGLSEVSFSPDNRVRFISGLPLDHVFYRGLKLENAKAPESGASDHNPLLLSFSLLQ
ncbi:endonuclease/exonuclease/phosphatase family protein [Vibrio diazotrophicus]|uniref:endonuclease/exonuclease/phosphatase family protein n=1 Tax=Vibrio diazotrophicus TaxID=685 RepID=UPI0022AEC6CF|nr:endonuclease/exonuclease/phosphatase family protein [Vibrio diazotrophicus]MCZ4370641.1 endonuclease/exonuclease/phosphatase family protein [Vibrio diazotrophicus]